MGDIPYQHKTWTFDPRKDFNLCKPNITYDAEINKQLREAYQIAITLAKWWCIAETAKSAKINIETAKAEDIVGKGKYPENTGVVWVTEADKPNITEIVKCLPSTYRYCMLAKIGTFRPKRHDYIMLSTHTTAPHFTLKGDRLKVVEGPDRGNGLGFGYYPVEFETSVTIKVFYIPTVKASINSSQGKDQFQPVVETVMKVTIDLDNPEIGTNLQGPHGPHVGYEVYAVKQHNEKVAIGHVLINRNDKLPSRQRAVYNGRNGLAASNFVLTQFKPEDLNALITSFNKIARECDGADVCAFIPVTRALAGPLKEGSIESLWHFLHRNYYDGKPGDAVKKLNQVFTGDTLRKNKNFNQSKYPTADF